MSITEKTRILFVSRAHGNGAGGMERLSLELSQALDEVPGTEVTLLTRPQTGRVGAIVWLFGIIPRVIAMARSHDVVYFGDPVLSLAGWLVKKITQAKVAVTVHGLDVSHPNPLYQLYLRLFSRTFNVYFPISSAAKEQLGNLSVTGKIVTVVPGVTDRYFDPIIERSQLQEIMDTDIRDKTILFTVGRLVKRKGHVWFVAQVLPKLPENVIYVVAGTGPETEAIGRAAREAGVADQVILLGRVSEGDLKILHNTVDAFIQPNIHVSDDVEGLGLVLLDAALCNRPVFAADLQGIPDAVHDGRNGTLLPTQDATAWQDSLQEWLAKSSPATESRDYTLGAFSWPKKAQEYTKHL